MSNKDLVLAIIFLIVVILWKYSVRQAKFNGAVAGAELAFTEVRRMLDERDSLTVTNLVFITEDLDTISYWLKSKDLIDDKFNGEE